MAQRLAENGSHEADDAAMTSTADEFVKEFPWIDRVTIESQLAFAQAHAVLHSALSRKYAELGISVSRFNALRLLHHTPDHRLTITDIGLRLGVSSASVTRLVDGLIRDGWVRRVGGNKDKRITHVELLDAGEARFELLLPRVLAVWNDLWTGLTQDDKKVLVTLNAKLRQSLLTSFASEGDLDMREY